MARMLAAALIAWLAVAAACSSQETDPLLQQAALASQRGDYPRAIEQLTTVVEQSPTMAIAWYLRGRANFCAGKIAESVADFDKYVELEPQAKNRLWERGISYYYAGQYEPGAKQFEDYQKYHDQDVENSVWRYLCVARQSGVAKARESLLPITGDPRAVMMEIYALYRGQLKPEDVLRAAGDNPPNREMLNQRLFYAHLYIGLWHEAAGDTKQAKEHILAAEKHKIAHYMWDVAHVHAERLRQMP